MENALVLIMKSAIKTLSLKILKYWQQEVCRSSVIRDVDLEWIWNGAIN